MKLLRSAVVAGALALAVFSNAPAQTPPAKSRAELLAAARAIMDSARFASFVTVDEQGQPQSRIVDPFAPDSDFTIWIGTNRARGKSRRYRNRPAWHSAISIMPGCGT